MPNKKALYRVKIGANDDIIMLALLVQYSKGELQFFDTDRGHSIPGRIDKEDADGFDFVRTYPDITNRSEEHWRFDLVTLDMWKKKIRDRVDHNHYLPEFQSTEDLWEYYRRFLSKPYSGLV